MIMIVMTHAMVVLKNELYQDIVMIMLVIQLVISVKRQGQFPILMIIHVIHNVIFVTIAEQFRTPMVNGMLLNQLLVPKTAPRLENVEFVLKHNLTLFPRLVIIFQMSGQ